MEVEYIVDSSVELGIITPMECAAIYLLPQAYDSVDDLILQNRALPDDFLENTARNALSLESTEKQYWVALNSLRHFEALSKDVQHRAVFLMRKKIQMDLSGDGEFRLIEGMSENPVAFREQKVLHSPNDVTETTIRGLLQSQMGGFLARLSKDAELVDAAILWYGKDGGEAFRLIQNQHQRTRSSVQETLNQQAFDLAQKSVLFRKRRPDTRKIRGVIKKVTKLFAQFKQEENLRLFVSGKEVELSHPDSSFKFILRPLGEPGWLESRSRVTHAHTPYDLSLLTKDDVFLAKLCVYIEKTPVLDQLLALALFVKSGEELKILEKANFFSFPKNHEVERDKLLAAYPSLVHKFPRKRTADEEKFDMSLDSLLRIRPTDGAADEFWEPVAGRVEAWVNTWFDPVLSQLLPKARMLQLAH